MMEEDSMMQTHRPIYTVEQKIKSEKADEHGSVNVSRSSSILPYLAHILFYKPGNQFFKSLLRKLKKTPVVDQPASSSANIQHILEECWEKQILPNPGVDVKHSQTDSGTS